MAMTGFDPDLVTSSINSVISAYDELMRALGDEMQNTFIGGMAGVWACNQAQRFFNDSFKPAIDSLIADSDKTFTSVVDAMNSGARAWAESTESSYSAVSFTAMNKTMDTSPVLENIGGVRGIDESAAQSVAAKLPSIASNAESALTNASSAVDNCGFIGGDQAAELKASLELIKTNLSNATTTLSNDTKSAIESTVTAYGDLAGQISQAFTAQ